MGNIAPVIAAAIDGKSYLSPPGEIRKHLDEAAAGGIGEGYECVHGAIVSNYLIKSILILSHPTSSCLPADTGTLAATTGVS